MSVASSQLFLFLALNAIVFVNALWLTCLFGGWRTWSERLLDCFLYFVALIVLSFEVLHFARWITLDGLFVFHIAVGLALAIAARRRGWEVRSFFTLEPVRGLGGIGQLLLCLFIAWLCAYLYYCRYLPPRGTDALIYHLVKPAHWLQEGHLSLMPLPFADPNVPYGPIHGELFLAWLMVPFGQEMVARFGQMPFLAMMMVAQYTLWRRWSLSTSLAMACAGLTLVFRPFLREIVVPNNDLMIACWCVAFVSFWQRFENDWRSWARCGVVLGLLAGTKVLGLIYLAPAILLLAFKAWMLRRSVPIREQAVGWVALVCVSVGVGGFQYFRNWAETGNPLYPAVVKIGGATIFHGVLDSDGMAAAHHSFTAAFGFLFSDTDTFSMGGRTKWIWAMGGLAALLAAVLRWKDRNQTVEVVVIWLMMAISYVLFIWKVPYLDVRLIFPVFIVGLVLLGWLLRWLGAVSHAAIPAVVLAGSFVCFATESIQIRTIVLYTLIGAPLLLAMVRVALQLARVRTVRWSRVLPFLMIALLLLLTVSVCGPFVERYQAMKYRAFPVVWPRHAEAWIWLNEQTQREGAVIAYTGSPHIYPLFGQELQNSLIYLPVEAEPAEFLHQMSAHEVVKPDSDTAFRHHVIRLARDQPDEKAWSRRILDSNATFLVVISEGSSEPIERSWAENRPDVFQKVLERQAITIYWIARKPEQTS